MRWSTQWLLLRVWNFDWCEQCWHNSNAMHPQELGIRPAILWSAKHFGQRFLAMHWREHVCGEPLRWSALLEPGISHLHSWSTSCQDWRVQKLSMPQRGRLPRPRQQQLSLRVRRRLHRRSMRANHRPLCLQPVRQQWQMCLSLERLQLRLPEQGCRWFVPIMWVHLEY